MLRQEFPALRRPSSFSIVKKARSALSFEEAPNSASLSVMIWCVRIPAQRAPSPVPDRPPASERDHAHLLHQRRVKGNLAEAIEDIVAVRGV